ncbi:MAG: cytochrome c maturation protein CcmE [Chloroflexi bacterium]|nr:cytochrome c maturation protein CcmE [Chloroflexota bacterium]
MTDASEPTGAAAPEPIRNRLLSGKFLFVGGALAAALGFLIWTATQGAAVYYHTVSELHTKRSEIEGRLVRVNGIVVDGSIEESADGIIRFEIEDATGVLPVEFRGSPPDLFGYAEEDKYSDVIAEGRLLGTGVFEARNLIVKHGPEFEPREIPAQ